MADNVRNFVDALEQEFLRNKNDEIASQQKAYMKGHFEYFGLKSPIRREIQKPFLAKAFLPPKDSLEEFVKHLWKKPQREFHYIAQELAFKYIKKMERKDIQLFEYMVANQSWWDTVDYIAPKLMGSYFQQFPDQKNLILKNGWLQTTFGCNDLVSCSNSNTRRKWTWTS